MFTIRKVIIDDRSLIHDLASYIWEGTYGKILSKERLDYMSDTIYASDSVPKQVEELHHQYFIISAGGMPAGCLSIEKTDESTHNFQKIYSLPEMHDAGIGRLITEQGTDYLKEVHIGSFTIKLYVNRYNPTIGFYRHMGLREIGIRDRHIGNGHFVNDYIVSIGVENK